MGRSEVRLNIVGFRVDPESEEPNLYVLTSTDQEETLRVVTVDGQIILFTTLDLATVALELAGICNTIPSVDPADVVWVDVARALYLLESEHEDQARVIENLLGMFAQIFNPLGIFVPDEYRGEMIELFRHLTFESDLESFFKEEITRKKMINGIQWCLGALLTNAHLLT